MNHLEEIATYVKLPMIMYCDNQDTIHIISNSIFHGRTNILKYIVILLKKESSVIATHYVSIGAQRAEIFTKYLSTLNWICYVTHWDCMIYTSQLEGES